MDKNTSIGAIAGVGIVLVIAFVFALFPAQSDDTILIFNGNNGTPEPCTGNVGLVLAQNITDLCDVTVVSPSTNQILQYNGSQWVNVASATFNDTTTCNNIGVGNAFVCVEGTNVDLRSLLNGTGIIVSNDTNTITITNSPPEATICDNAGGIGKTIHIEGSNCTAKILIAGSGLAVTNDSSSITFINQFPESTECFDSTGTGISIITNTTNADCYFKTFLNGTSISITGNTTHITITNTAPDNTVCANVGTGTVIYKDGECNFKTLVGSPDISVTNTTNTVVIDYNGTHVTSLTSDDTATLSYSASTGAITTTPVLKKLCEFTGVGGETSIACTFSSSQQVFEVQVHYNSSVTNTVWVLRFNNDTGSNYSLRSSTNGGADATTASQAFFATQTITANQMNSYILTCHDHMSTFEKWCNGDRTAKASGSNAPARVELYGTWNNRTTDITSINLTRTASTGTLFVGAHIIVWGYS
jgi:hypothetical protein